MTRLFKRPKNEARKLRQLNRLTWMLIILFLVVSIGTTIDDDGIIENKFEFNLITFLIAFFGIGGVKHALSSAAEGASDGIDLPGVDL